MALRAALVRAGLGSRREMAASLGAQKVTLNGVVADVNAKLRAGDVVALNGKVVANIHSLPQHTTVLLHKPLGVVSTCSDPQVCVFFHCRKTMLLLLLLTVGLLRMVSGGAPCWTLFHAKCSRACTPSAAWTCA
jgi:16S rRNA U516 pseudouridylate synthase RsuA-like enzyme